MRMWKVDPSLMCRQHLLGEHLEMHMFVGAIRKGVDIGGYVRKGLVEVHYLNRRHKELVQEMTRRGYKHHTPLFFVSRKKVGRVDVRASVAELRRRCPACRKLRDK